MFRKKRKRKIEVFHIKSRSTTKKKLEKMTNKVSHLIRKKTSRRLHKSEEDDEGRAVEAEVSLANHFLVPFLWAFLYRRCLGQNRHNRFFPVLHSCIWN